MVFFYFFLNSLKPEFFFFFKAGRFFKEEKNGKRKKMKRGRAETAALQVSKKPFWGGEKASPCPPHSEGGVGGDVTTAHCQSRFAPPLHRGLHQSETAKALIDSGGGRGFVLPAGAAVWGEKRHVWGCSSGGGGGGRGPKCCVTVERRGGGKGIGRHTEPPVSCESREKLAGWGGRLGRTRFFFPPEREKGGKKR